MKIGNFKQAHVNFQKKPSIFYKTFVESSILDDYEAAHSFDKIKKLRPLSFSISFARGQHELDNNFKKFEEINYTIENLNTHYVLGIRSDLYSLGFNFDTLKSFISSPERHQLIRDKINSLINKSDSGTAISRKDEIEILEEFFK